MSTPVRGPDGPLGYAPRWARVSGGGRANAAFGPKRSLVPPVQELAPEQDLKPPRIALPPRGSDSTRDVPPPRDFASTRDAAPPQDSASVRDAAPPRDFASARDAAPPRDLASTRNTAPPRDSASLRDTKSSRASVVTQEAVQDSATDSLWKRKKRPPIFEGDAAMRDLRARLALAPDQMPEPPLYPAKAPIFAVVARLMGVMVLAAGGALGFLWVTAPHAALPDGQGGGQTGGEVALVSLRGIEASKPAPSAENVRTERVPEAQASSASWKMANYTRDITDGVGNPSAALAPRNPVPAAPRAPAARVSPPQPAVPTPQPVVAIPASPPAVAVPTPQPAVAIPAPQPAVAIPAPQPAVAVPAPQPAVAVPAPKPAVVVPAARTAAPMAAPAPSPSTAASPDRDEVAALLTRARTYLSAGDVAAARLVLRRAAERDDAQAALALGGTYDPVVLRRLGIINFHSDPAQARDWYRKAAELGSTDASLRLEQLVQTDR
jgi:hypothetical protein